MNIIARADVLKTDGRGQERQEGDQLGAIAIIQVRDGGRRGGGEKCWVQDMFFKELLTECDDGFRDECNKKGVPESL